MKTDVIEMLVYLCENGFVDFVDASEENTTLEALAGERLSPPDIPLFEKPEDKSLQVISLGTIPSVRVFSDEELDALAPSCREAIGLLGRLGVLDHAYRELVIDYLMMLEEQDLGVEDLKWAVVMAFMTEPLESIYSCYPDVSIFEDATQSWH